jgi:hypothetical protein
MLAADRIERVVRVLATPTAAKGHSVVYGCPTDGYEEHPSFRSVCSDPGRTCLRGRFCRSAATKEIPQVGWIALFGPDNARPSGLFTTPFLAELRDRGRIEGQNLIIHHRSAEARQDRLPEIGADLIHLKADVIVADNTRVADPVGKRGGQVRAGDQPQSGSKDQP